MEKMTKNEWIAVVVVVILISSALTFTNLFGFFSPPSNYQENTPTPMPQNSQNNTVTSLKIDNLLVGSGAEATVGKTVTVNYTGRLTNGKVFDSSIPRGQPFSFTLGEGRVIAGWEQGVLGMKVGGKRRLTIPASLGYGSQQISDGAGNAVIPANSTLIFDIELLDVK